MATRRKSIKLLGHERELLIKQYLRWRIPVDQFESRPKEWDSFTDEWNEQSGRDDTEGELLHYMRSQRKQKLWVRLDGDHTKAPPPPVLTPEETEALVNIFNDNVTVQEQGCSDVLGFDESVAECIAKEFADATGRIVPAHELVAKLTALRKRGLLPKVRDQARPPEDTGFSDIDEAVG